VNSTETGPSGTFRAPGFSSISGAQPRLGEGDQGDEQGKAYDRALLAAGDDRVHDAPGEDRRRDGEQRGRHAEQDELRDAAAVRRRCGGGADGRIRRCGAGSRGPRGGAPAERS
jgi:hypothetical protein